MKLLWLLLFCITTALAQEAGKTPGLKTGGNKYIVLVGIQIQRVSAIAAFSCTVFPTQYNVSGAEIQPINGSCSATCTDQHTCQYPQLTPPFDGAAQTLGPQDSKVWAHQLLTLKISSLDIVRTVAMAFSFPDNDEEDFTDMWQLQVTLFNCPQWMIGTDTYLVQEQPSSGQARFIGQGFVTDISCDSVVNSSVFFNSTSLTINLLFSYESNPELEWIHLGEILFYRYKTVLPQETQTTELIDYEEVRVQPASTITTCVAESQSDGSISLPLSLVIVLIVIAGFSLLSLLAVATMMLVVYCFRQSRSVKEEEEIVSTVAAYSEPTENDVNAKVPKLYKEHSPLGMKLVNETTTTYSFSAVKDSHTSSENSVEIIL